ncbi:ulp1 protease family, C-terminal catalytic domain-containing protein [Tanacetum coccineum]
MGSRIKANEGSSLEVYDAKVSARSRLYLLKTIGSKLAFKPERYKKFRSTVIWLLETYPNSKTWWVEEKNVIPRVVAWSDGNPFLKNDYDCLIQVHREVDVRTNVHHDVDEGLSVPDVHHDVEEGLSVPELLKKISDMQRDFQSRITAVEQFVNHHKTSKIGSDSHVTNVFSNSMEFDHHDFGSLTENPHNRVALMKKITDMEVEFQRRITSIEDFLKIPRSPNLEKTSNVAAECMSVDKNPSCGSDVKAGNKESMCVDSSVKTSCATDINANNVHNDSMDFDHDPKVVEQNEFDQNVADKNLIHDFEQSVEWENLLKFQALEEPQLSGLNFIVEEHQHVSSKNCEVPLAGAEMIAFNALMKIINFDIPKESPIQPMVIETPVEGCKSGETSKSMISETQSHTCDSVEEANDAKVLREAKASKYRISPYMIQPEFTQQNHKVRVRNKKVKKRGLPLTARNGKVIPDWKEDLFRPKHALKTKTIMLPEISDILQHNKDKCFYFPLTNEGSFVCSNFWERLLGIGKERREWLSDTMLCCYVDGVTYGVPWFSESVKKVYFPINAEDNHWILAEFHICSGVITFYDSLPPENLIVEDQKWWMYVRQVYADKLPKLLIQSEVMEKKSIDPSNYSISYRVYEVDDRLRIQIVELCNRTCTCRKCQVLRLPCGHVLAIYRVIGLTDCNRLAKGWFMRIALKDQRARNVLDLKVRNRLQSDVEGAGRVVTTDKGVGKPFHTQKKGHILEEAHSKQMTTYRNQCHGLSMLIFYVFK